MDTTRKKMSTRKTQKTSTPILIAVFVILLALFSLIMAWSYDRSRFAQSSTSSKPIPKEKESTKRPAPVLSGKIFGPGSYWVYETLDATLTVKITGTKKIGKYSTYHYEIFYGDEKIADEYRIHNSKELSLVKSAQKDTTVNIFNPPIARVKFPLRVGDKWVNKYKYQGVDVISEVSVLSYEKVKTKAGVFMCYKIHHKTYVKGDEKNAIVDADWYSPIVGLVSYAKRGGENPKSLLKYKIVEVNK